eukprot:m.246447 g.246447  ORF g.246447 m.246447 type:complete len:600 (+) comp15043_c0_seq1:151-1950(+)
MESEESAFVLNIEQSLALTGLLRHSRAIADNGINTPVKFSALLGATGVVPHGVSEELRNDLHQDWRKEIYDKFSNPAAHDSSSTNIDTFLRSCSHPELIPLCRAFGFEDQVGLQSFVRYVWKAPAETRTAVFDAWRADAMFLNDALNGIMEPLRSLERSLDDLRNALITLPFTVVSQSIWSASTTIRDCLPEFTLGAVESLQRAIDQLSGQKVAVLAIPPGYSSHEDSGDGINHALNADFNNFAPVLKGLDETFKVIPAAPVRNVDELREAVKKFLSGHLCPPELDCVVVIYGGHGELGDDEKSTLLKFDKDFDASELITGWGQAHSLRSLLVLLDCCNGGPACEALSRTAAAAPPEFFAAFAVCTKGESPTQGLLRRALGDAVDTFQRDNREWVSESQLIAELEKSLQSNNITIPFSHTKGTASKKCFHVSHTRQPLLVSQAHTSSLASAPATSWASMNPARIPSTPYHVPAPPLQPASSASTSSFQAAPAFIMALKDALVKQLGPVGIWRKLPSVGPRGCTKTDLINWLKDVGLTPKFDAKSFGLDHKLEWQCSLSACSPAGFTCILSEIGPPMSKKTDSEVDAATRALQNLTRCIQ